MLSISVDADVVAIYALLLAIEERGVERFPLIAEAFRPYDPETADTYLRLARDERGHVKYCQTIGRHHAKTAEAWDAAVAEARALEAQVFLEVGPRQPPVLRPAGLGRRRRDPRRHDTSNVPDLIVSSVLDRRARSICDRRL
jgi:hypothetical protein